MREAMPLAATREQPRPRSVARAAGRAVRATGRMLARLNGTHAPADVHAADMAQLRRAMRD